MTGALIICMGVSGSGKSTLAQSLATHFSLPFLEADDFHSIENRQKMASGIALTDKDREPWMMDIA
ncbi:MAG: gluconokinase, partial [Pseudomonadota bacterium]